MNLDRAGCGESHEIWGKECKGLNKMFQGKARPARVQCRVVRNEARKFMQACVGQDKIGV